MKIPSIQFQKQRLGLRYIAVMVAILLACYVVGLQAQPALKDAYKDDFLVGAALNPSQYADENSPQAKLVKSQFNSITAENVMKWGAIHPRPDQYQFEAADEFVDFGHRNGMSVIGHTLVWHNQTPDWVFKNTKGEPLTREELLERMRDHIHKVVGRYKGRVKGWDVVNEALAEDGSLRESPWKRIIGDDYIQKAFEYAHEADPEAELYYNDYGIEHDAKRKGAINLLEKLKNAGVHITGVGIQEHVNLTWPSLETLDKTITDFAGLGLKVMITELDVDVLPSAQNQAGNAEITRREASKAALNPYAKGLPDDIQQKLARRYADLFGVYLKHRESVTRVTLWGVNDGDSWLNDWPVRGRASHPLLFDRKNQPKPAFKAVLGAAAQPPAP